MDATKDAAGGVAGLIKASHGVLARQMTGGQEERPDVDPPGPYAGLSPVHQPATLEVEDSDEEEEPYPHDVDCPYYKFEEDPSPLAGPCAMTEDGVCLFSMKGWKDGEEKKARVRAASGKSWVSDEPWGMEEDGRESNV